MAKKPRTPPPPRKIQAPKQRHAPRQGLGADRTRMILYAVAGAGAIAVAIVLIVLVAGGKSSSAKVASGASDPKVKQAMLAAGCTFVSKPVLPPKHGNFHADAPKITTKVKWSTFPPSGGGHYAAWAIWNFYTDPVPPQQAVHNLEHGGVVLWWGPKVPDSTVSQLRDFYNESPTGMLGTPLAGLGDKVAVSAWVGDPSRYYKDKYYGIGKLSTCPSFSEKAFATFRDTYRGHGPEGIPLASDQQGTGPF